MDQEEEAVAERAGSSACKRQKRNNSAGDAADGETETATDAAAEEAPSAAAPVAASTPATIVDASALSEMDIILLGFAKNRKEADNVANRHNNNNNNSGADDNTLETQTTNETAPTSSTATAATATTTTDANDDDAVASDAADELQVIDVEPDFSEMLATFNRPRILSTRSYRSVLTSSSSSSNSNDSSPANDDHNYSTNTSDTNVDDDDVDEVADSSDADEQESPVLVPPEDDDSSSDSSMALWNRYPPSSSNDPDSDDAYIPTNPNDKLQVDTAVDNIMGKPKPAYALNLVDQLMYREHNIMNRIDWRGGHTSGMNFIQNFYGSRQVVERMTLTKNMSFHLGCVNSLNFNRSGDLLCSGSDDLSIIVWDWASGKPRQIIRSGHTLNIFQTKFLDSAGCLDIVSSSRDGQVRRAVIPPSGASKIKPMRLYSHAEAVHKLVVVPHSRHEIISVGEDAAVKHFDLRNNKVTSMLRCTDNKRRVRLFSIAHHPFAPEFCISGSDDKLRVYDKRQLNKPVHEMTPKDIKDEKITQITCAVYNHSGSEILASYSDAGIYLYDSRNYKDGEYLHSYEGHINSRTIKGVNFFGPRSEYVVSGSDCGNIFFWDKNTEAVINFKKGDLSGVVNCLEPHPWMPVLATSGLEHKVKIWTPSGLPEALPKPEALKETLQRNFRRSILDLGEFDINHIHYFIRQLIDPRLGSSSGARSGADQARRYSSSSSDSSSNPNSPPGGGQPSSSDEGNPNPMGCNTQ